MGVRPWPVTIVLAAIVLVACASVSLRAQGDAGSIGRAAAGFMENRGQVIGDDGLPHADVAFTARSEGVRLFFSSRRISHVLATSRITVRQGVTNAPPTTAVPDLSSLYRLDMEIVGATAGAGPVGVGVRPERANFYLAGCPEGILNVASYDRLVYRDIYQGVDLIYYRVDRGLKYDFVVKPGRRARQIAMRYTGATRIEIEEDGSLSIETPLGTLREDAPVAWTIEPDAYRAPDGGAVSAESRRDVDVAWEIDGDVVRFCIGAYDRSQVLVIDPGLKWATYNGGAAGDAATDVAVDSLGNVILVGQTTGSDFPATPGAFQQAKGAASDAVAAKFDPDGAPIWMTFIGGENFDRANGVAIDRDGSLLIAGGTSSNRFPVTVGAFQTRYGGGQFFGGTAFNHGDAWLMKLGPDGTRIWGTYYGGSVNENAYKVAVDGAGNAVVVGATQSRDLPISLDAWQPALGGAGTGDPAFDMFAVAFSPDGTRRWGTYIGGDSNDEASAVTVTPTGEIAIAGSGGLGFPATRRLAPALIDDLDAAVVFLDANGIRRWATLLGGRDPDRGRGIAIDPAGYVVVGGNTESADFPTSPGAAQSAFAGGGDLFVAKLDGAGAIAWSTYVGSPGFEGMEDVATDRDGGIVVMGYGRSGSTIAAPDPFPYGGGSDGFAFFVSPDGMPGWGTFYGGSDDDYALAGAIAPGGELVLAGGTYSTDIPTMNPWGAANMGDLDQFVAVFECVTYPIPNILLPAGDSIAPGETVAIPIVIDGVKSVLPRDRRFAITLAWNPSVLLPVELDVLPEIVNGDTLYRLEGVWDGRSDTLAVLELLAALGNADRTSVSVRSIEVEGRCPSAVNSATAEIAIAVCREGGTRLFITDRVLALKPARPNPARERTTIAFSTIEPGPVRLAIVDVLGRSRREWSEILSPDHYAVDVDLRGLETGRYLVVLYLPSGARAVPLDVVR